MEVSSRQLDILVWISEERSGLEINSWALSGCTDWMTSTGSECRRKKEVRDKNLGPFHSEAGETRWS